MFVCCVLFGASSILWSCKLYSFSKCKLKHTLNWLALSLPLVLLNVVRDYMSPSLCLVCLLFIAIPTCFPGDGSTITVCLHGSNAPTIVCTPVVLDLDLLVKFTVRKFWCMLLCSWWCQAVWSSFCICNTNSSSCSGRPQHHASLLLLWLVGVSIYLFIVFLISCVNNKHVWYFTIYTCYECCSSLLNLLAPPFIRRTCCYLLCYTRSRCFGC